MRERNWAGNVLFSARRLHRPASIEALQEIVAAARHIRVLGSRHSFNTIADSSELVSLALLPGELHLDRAAGTASCGAGLTYGELARQLHAAGLALANLGSLPHISVGGSVATATHGSGDRNGNLATAVAGLEMVTSAGELIAIRRGDPDFDGMVVGLGSLGVVTRIALDVEPAYEISQRVYENLSWHSLHAHFDELTAAGYSVSVFTRWGDEAGQIWVKRRVPDVLAPEPDELLGARAATRQLHPIAGGDPDACTLQLGTPGPWHERLPHFRLEFTPSAGAELQSEYLLPRGHARAAIEAVRRLAPRIRPLLHIAEIRTVAADELWMSPQYGRDTVALHFTWQRDQPRVEHLLVELEDALAPFAPRPHWGKLFLAEAAAIAPRYERLADFARLVARLDPRRAFHNSWLETRVLGPPGR
ncbi:MAG TPA: FAD-binding protein [Burkholderiales bacterium]|nr:FAD-binding protein [Burkholderiales bacterium]